MPYILKGTKTLIGYWETLGRPCGRYAMAQAVGAPQIHFDDDGIDAAGGMTIQYGEAQAQSLAAALGVTVANVTTNGGQILI